MVLSSKNGEFEITEFLLTGRGVQLYCFFFFRPRHDVAWELRAQYVCAETMSASVFKDVRSNYFTRHAIHERALSNKMNNDRTDDQCYSFSYI